MAYTGYRCLRLECCDTDRLAGVIDETSMRHRILPGGALRIKAEKLGLGSGVMQRGRYEMGILVNGVWPTGKVAIGLVLEAPEDILVNGFVCPPLSIQLYSEGCELLYRAAPGTTWFAYCVERDHIQKEAVRLYGRPLPIPGTGSVSVRPEPEACRRIAATVQSLFTLGAAPVSSGVRHTVRVSLKDQFHYHLASALCAEPCGNFDRHTKHVVQRRRVAEDAEEYLRANMSGSFSLSGLAEATGTSQRMLEYHFQNIYGVSPQVWFRSMKLDAVRQELLESGSTNRRISDIAMRWGFVHLGRFSVEYRQLFGERPKDTLGRR